MTRPPASPDPSLAFFGRVTASVSHDLKNHLAVLKEQAGLIGDFVAMAARGRPLDPARLATLAENMVRRVNLADEVIKRLNRFAHSVDSASSDLDLGDTAAEVVDLTQRLAGLKGVTLALQTPPAPVIHRADPFLLRRLIFAGLELAFEAAGKGGRVELAVASGGGPEIFISGQPAGPAAATLKAQPVWPEAELLGLAAEDAPQGLILSFKPSPA